MGFGDFQDESLEQLEGLKTRAQQGVKQAPKQTATVVKSQISGADPAAAAQKRAEAEAKAKEEKATLLDHLYGPTKPQAQPGGKSPSFMTMVSGISPQEKSPEEQAKLKQLREKLHYELYYKAIDDIGKAKEQEQTKADEKEQEEQQKKQEKQLEVQKNQKTQEDLAVANARRGTGETLKGVGG